MSSSSRKMLQAAAGVGGDFYPYTIDYSCRFNDNDSAKMTRTQTAGDTQKFTYSAWVKRGNLGINGHLIQAGEDDNTAVGDMSAIRILSNDTLEIFEYLSGYRLHLNTARKFRDTSSFYHIVVSVDTTQSTASDRVKLWVNGVQETDFTTETYPSQNYNLNFNQSGEGMYLGVYANVAISDFFLFDGYMSQVAYVDGTAYTADDFGQSKNGVWVPKDVSGLTFGTNGFYLDFSNSAALGTDVSGNGNNWAPSGLTSSDQMTDTPTSNTATLNPLNTITGSYSEGNLKAVVTGVNHCAISNMGVSSGKYYFEARLDGETTHPGYDPIGVTNYSGLTNWYTTAHEVWTYLTQLSSYEATTSSSSGSVVYDTGGTLIQFGAGDIISCAVDMDAGKIWWAVNGTWIQDSSGNTGDPSTGANARYSNLSGTIFPLVAQSHSGSSATWSLNFGQNGTFNGSETAGGNSDANGNGDYKYTVPTGFLGFSTANLPEPTIGPNSATTSDENFNTVLYVGNGTAIGSGGKSVTGVGFQPDMVWTKNRDAAQSWAWMDTQIGTGKYWTHNYTSTGVITNSESLASMDSDGFTVGSLANANVSGQNYVAYCFKKVAGVFDTVGYSGTGSVQNISHNLGAVPKVIIVKRVTNANTAPAYFDGGQVSDPETDYISMFDTSTGGDNNTVWNDTAPTSTQFTVGTSNGINLSSDTFVAYLFAEVEGFSSFGKYTGNGSTDGPFVYTGFRPAFVITKRIDTSGYNWVVTDAGRDQYNVADAWLYADSSSAEVSNSDTRVDFLSNGFKLRGQSSTQNASGGTWLYMAFAENPFKYANAR